VYLYEAILDFDRFFKAEGLEKIENFKLATHEFVRRSAQEAAEMGEYCHEFLNDRDLEVYRFTNDAAFETFVLELTENGLGDLIAPLSLAQVGVLPFAFTHVVPKAEMKRRAERLEAQAGFLPWLDWSDFLDQAETELLKELRRTAKRLNIRQHEIERDGSSAADGMAVKCSFINETDLVFFKLAI
jgi:hypothetical protein